MTRTQQMILFAIAAIIGAALVVGVIKKKFPHVVPGARPAVEAPVTAGSTAVKPPAKVIPPYMGQPPAPRGDYDVRDNQAIQSIQGQFKMLSAALTRAIVKNQLGFDEFEKLHFGGASGNVDPAYAVFNPEGKIKFRPIMGAWIDQAALDRVTKTKKMAVYYTLRRQKDSTGTVDTLYGMIPSPNAKFCKAVRSAYTLKPALKFAADNTKIVVDEDSAFPNDAMKKPSCITSGDGRVYYFHPLRTRFLRAGGTMWQGR